MITEKGSIKTEFTPCERAERQYTKGLFTVSVICLALGSAGVGAYLTLDILSVFNITAEPMIWILVLVAVPFAFGLIFTVSLTRIYGKLRKNAQEVRTECEFFSDCFTFVTEADGASAAGAVVASARVAYPQIIKRKETKDYIFVTADMTNMVTVDKNVLSEGEINALRKVFGLTADGGECVSLPSGVGNEREINEE